MIRRNSSDFSRTRKAARMAGTLTKPGNDRFDRPPPQNVDAEKGLLGSILLENHVLDDVADMLHADHFYLDRHQRIYRAIMRLHESGVHGFDPITIGDSLKQQNELAEAGGYDYLAELLERVPHAGHTKYY